MYLINNNMISFERNVELDFPARMTISVVCLLTTDQNCILNNSISKNGKGGHKELFNQ